LADIHAIRSMTVIYQGCLAIIMSLTVGVWVIIETKHVEKVNDLIAREIDTSKCHKFETGSKREG